MNRPQILAVTLLSSCAGGRAGDDAGDGGATSLASLGGSSGVGDMSTGTGEPGTAGAPAEDAAEIVAAKLPAALACGQPFAAEVTVRNAGAATWTRAHGYKLGAVDDSDPLYAADTRVWLADGDVVAPGDLHTFAFELVAPAVAGSYTTDWRMVHEGVQWFGETASQQVEVACEGGARGGVVRLEGRSLVDDGGPFNALGATMMWAAWGYKFDRARLEQNLQFLSDHGYHYIRALGVVGDYEQEDYWEGREIDWRWPDYAEVIAGLTDLAYDKYGLRVEWTLIGDGQINIPDEADRYALVDTFVAMAAARPHKIMHFELANEAWQNGFAGDAGRAQLRALTAYMRDESDNLVAASAPEGHECETIQAIYAGEIADLATIHFDRDISKVEGPWRPVRQPWELQFCAGVPVGSNNEPIGPGASVAEENDPLRLVAGAITTHVSGLPLYVFHSRAGIRGDQNLWEMPGADAFVHLRALVPGDLASWDLKNAHWPDSPFVVYAGEGGQLYPDTMWVDLAAPDSGVVRAYGATRDQQFVVFPIGVLNDVTLAARRAMTFEVLEPLTGAVLHAQQLAAGEQFVLSGGEALLIRGEFLD